MTIEQGDTQPAVDELQPSTEQAQIPAIAEDRGAIEPDQEPAPDAAPKPEGDKAEAPVDPRADRIERLAETRQRSNAEELAEVAETFTKPEGAPSAAPPAAPERMIKLKIRGEEVELPESEVIARAQKNDAADSYLTEARNILEETKRAAKAPPAPAPEAEQPKVEKVDRLAKAIETIQTGGDPVEARAILDEELNERAQAAARNVVDSDRLASRSAVFDQDVTAGFEQAAAEQPDLMKDPIKSEVVFSFNAALQRHLVAEQVAALPESAKQAFAAAGITPETIPSYSPQDINALYKDMALKGYHLPAPSTVIRSAAKTIAERMPGLTPPAPAPTPSAQPQPAVNREERKVALVQQPERVSIPRPTNRTPTPKSEPERAASARDEIRASRRTGVAIRRG